MTFIIPDYEDGFFKSYLWRSERDWTFRREAFYKGIESINKNRDNKAKIITLSHFIPIAYVAVDYHKDDNPENSFINVGHYLLSTEESNVERYSFITRPQDGEIYKDYQEQVLMIEEKGENLFNRNGDILPLVESISVVDEKEKPLRTEEFDDELIVPLLNSVLKNESLYAFNAGKHDLMRSIFPDGKTEFEYHYAMLPLDSSFERLRGSEAVQRGKLCFILTDKMCRLSAKFINSKGFEVEYKGFAIILSPNGISGNCWCFLRLNDKNLAELGVFCFRVRGREGNSWKTRIAETLTIKSVNSRPIVCRTLLSKKYIEDSEIKYFRGHLKLNRASIHINEETFNAAINFFNNKPPNPNEELIYKDLEEHFANVSPSVVLDILLKLRKNSPNNVMKIDCNYHSFDGHHNLSTLKYDSTKSPFGPLVLSWLRKYASTSDNNQVLGSLDKEVEDMLKWLEAKN